MSIIRRGDRFRSGVFGVDAALLIKTMLSYGFKGKAIHEALLTQGFSYTYEQVKSRISWERYQAGNTRPKYIRVDTTQADYDAKVPGYVPTHEQRAKFDKNAHREARHYQGNFEL